MTRKTLTAAGIAKLKPKPSRYAVPDPELRGHYIRVAPSGAKSYVTVARDPNGKQIWTTIGPTDVLPIDDAREQARETIRRVRAGMPAHEPVQETFPAVAENWLKRHVQANGFRSEKEVTRLLHAHILPAWKDKPFLALRRSDVAALLDEVEDDHGARQADHVLAIVSGICNWFATRNDDYASPVARGMRRTSPKARARVRILDDDEIRAVWRAAEAMEPPFGAFVRIALLTAQRREKLATLKWADITIDGAWHIAMEAREKGTPGVLLLPDAAVAIIRAQPRFEDNPFVFAGRSGSHFSSFGRGKADLDALVPIPAWTIHDLRRTARSLMSRCGVAERVAERVLGHVIPGVAGIYDRHSYRLEMGDALKRLAALIETIVSPPADNVVRLREAAR